jgi:hypothetical protein
MSPTAKILAVGLALVALVGCRDTKTTFAVTVATSGAAAKPSADFYSKKLVGVWEGTAPKDPDRKVTLEFKADATLTFTIGGMLVPGTYRIMKEEGKVVTLVTELKYADEKESKTTMKATFDDADSMTMTPVDKNDPVRLKRKS